MKWLAGALLTVVLLMQYRLWLSNDGRLRLELQSAGFELNQAWRMSLQRPGATLVNQ